MENSMRKVRALKRWMKSESIDCSQALKITLTNQQQQQNQNQNQSYFITALFDLNDGDLVATIPKHSCLTVKTSHVFSSFVLEPDNDSINMMFVRLAVAFMYERSLGVCSAWFAYLDMLPTFGEPVPLLWSPEEVDTLLTGTELHKSCHVIASSMKKMIAVAGKMLVGLAVAVMYERSLGEGSAWFAYLDMLPTLGEPVPLLWSPEEVDTLLTETELHKIIEEDKVLFYEEWEEYILPLLASSLSELNSDFFSVEQYFAARSLISSRSFQIDDYHGFGMVPLADLFNHKTGDENVHITSASSHSIHESFAEDINSSNGNESPVDDNDELFAQSSPSKNDYSEDTSETSSSTEDDPSVLEIIIVKAVKSGSEVFNTYGSLGNAALLHRYGFAELNNPYDIVNIDLELVLEWSSFSFSTRHSRARLSLWRRLDYSGCTSNSEEYFEISFNGEPQIELLILIYILLLPDEAFFKLDLAMSTSAGTLNGPFNAMALLQNSESKLLVTKSVEMSEEESRHVLLTGGVCDALSSLANIREGLYGSTSLEDDISALDKCCSTKDRKLHHSLILKVSERRILQKLREYAKKRVVTGKRLKRK